MEGKTGWKQFKGMETPSTVELSKEFFKNVPKGSNIVDFGCAWGRIAFELQSKGYSVTGFDINENTIAYAKETSKKTNEQYENKVKFQTANATNLPYQNETFDACIIQAFLTTIIKTCDRTKVLKEANRILKEKGVLYLADFGQNWENPHYSERYMKNYPITGEMGTFTVKDESNPDGRELFKAHHYTKEELLELVKGSFNVKNLYETIFTTFNGNRTKGYIIIAIKP
jgi:ubiquinone/menaquinone biosynthesis C-methylase UbiE